MSSSAYIVAFIAISLYYFQFHHKNLPPAYEGIFLPESRSVAELFRSQVESGQEIGGTFAVYYKGRLVVDLWGGYADRQYDLQKWRNDTLTITFSTTKGMVSILAAKMVDQKLLDYNKLVSHYWPGFGCNGKENVTVEMLLHHAAGLAYLNKPFSMLELHHNPLKVEKVLEKEPPKWPPGTATAYHALTFGAYVDRLLTNADPKHRRIDQLFEEEIAQPFDIDFRIGLPKNLSYRGARFEPFGINEFLRNAIKTPSMWMMVIKLLLNPNNLLSKASNAVTGQITNDPYMREIAISSVSGHGTARGMAKLYGILANGGKLGNKQFLSQETIKAFTDPKMIGESLNYGGKIKMGRGLYYSKNPKDEDVYGHPGYGGQMAFGDPIHNIGMAYLTNDLSAFGYGNDPKFLALQKEFYNCLGKIEKSKSSLGTQFDMLSVS
ncbi:beta-lactamase domain-containing protein 2-like [Mytilus trossulus]|uniref:beta-lactamase domain-containing protein 2-like n=1 Tax=Mytilus trossulus TaxID=6551 RepID=UPI0030042656